MLAELWVVDNVWWIKAQFEFLDSRFAFFETRHGRATGGIHHLDKYEDLVLMLPSCLEAPALDVSLTDKRVS